MPAPRAGGNRSPNTSADATTPATGDNKASGATVAAV